jgi:hypothetical protein
MVFSTHDIFAHIEEKRYMISRSDRIDGRGYRGTEPEVWGCRHRQVFAQSCGINVPGVFNDRDCSVMFLS